ncbi:MAG: hypothetical protein ACI8P3_002779 [Saprospiraceae bacterium]|jgi:hypothetical protein
MFDSAHRIGSSYLFDANYHKLREFLIINVCKTLIRVISGNPYPLKRNDHQAFTKSYRSVGHNT